MNGYKVLFYAVCGLCLILAILLYGVKNEITDLNNLIKAATYLNEGEVEKAVDEVDNVDPKTVNLTGKNALLANQIREKYSLFLLDRALLGFIEGDFARAQNDLGVAEVYAKFSVTVLPPIAERLKEALSKR
jgi:hypothetical protein